MLALIRPLIVVIGFALSLAGSARATPLDAAPHALAKAFGYSALALDRSGVDLSASSLLVSAQPADPTAPANAGAASSSPAHERTVGETLGYAALGLFMLGFYVWMVVLAFQVGTGWGLIAALVPCGQLVFAVKHWQQAKVPFLLRILVLFSLVFFFAVRRYQQLSAEAGLRSAASAAVANAPQPIPPPAAAAPVSPPPPATTGLPVDLSTIMGRARALADAWQRDAALIDIDATHFQDGVLQTGQGGVARLTFGPSPFAPPGSRVGRFLVSYDAAGLRSEPLLGETAKATSLMEPMCAPEEVYRRAAAGGRSSLTLRYTFDAPRKRAVWLAIDSAPGKAISKAFDGQSCVLVAH